jgi:hypothetical protein
VTANTTAKITTDDLSTPHDAANVRARAERLLLRVADHGEKILANTTDPLDVPDYVLLTLVQAGDALVRLAELDADREQRLQAGEPDLIVDVLGEKWFHQDDDPGNYAAEDDPAKVFAAAYIRNSWGPTREYVLLRPRPGD